MTGAAYKHPVAIVVSSTSGMPLTSKVDHEACSVPETKHGADNENVGKVHTN
jgi:hypothetical protein